MGAPFVQDGEPVLARQAEIQHRRVVMFGVAEVAGVHAVGDQIHRAAFLPQRARDGGTKIGIVLDKQDAHDGGLSPAAKPKLNRGVQRGGGADR